jgi:hypothetical protein
MIPAGVSLSVFGRTTADVIDCAFRQGGGTTGIKLRICATPGQYQSVFTDYSKQSRPALASNSVNKECGCCEGAA